MFDENMTNELILNHQVKKKRTSSKHKFDRIISSVFRYPTSPCVLPINSMQDIETISQTSSCILINSPQHFEKFDEVVNIVELPFSDKSRVVRFMKRRYLHQGFYTWAGQTLLAVHPYQEVKFQREDVLRKPSISALVHKAWFRLQNNLGKPNQAVVISGESGAGKTYSACLAMKYIANKEQDCSGNPFENILWQAWSSVPLLTAFGNAPTTHNSNSSRFGKLLQLQYNGGSIRGAYIQTYLLEKSRVAGPNEGEGNFHIFRQILDSLDAETLAFLYLNKATNYRIAPKLGLRSTYTETMKSLEILNIPEMDKILIVLSLILNFGNISFECGSDCYTITHESYEYAENVSKLLHTPVQELVEILCNIQFTTRGASRRNTVFKSACINREECEERRNCIMKFLYGSLFAWLVDCINARIFNPGTHHHLGLLDVYGFESFDVNTFEQLCINYANERLQQYFMNDYLVYKKQDLQSEGLDFEALDTLDYTERVTLLDGPVSIFGILNEECVVKRFNTDLFVNTRLTETLRGRAHFLATLNDLQTTFSIRHYAGVVKYDATGMLAKNRDKVPDDIIEFLTGCDFDFLKQLVGKTADGGGKTLISKFKKSLDELMKILDGSDVHYIKCLKPNPYKLSEFFDDDFFRQQLTSNGIYEILKLSFQKYSIKVNFEEFIGVFGCALYNLLQKPLKDEMHLGRKHLYLSERGYHTFQTLKRINRSILARRIQLFWWRYYDRRVMAATIIQRFYRSLVLDRSVLRYGRFIDLSKKSSEQSVAIYKSPNLLTINTMRKIEHFLSRHRFDVNFEGDRLSLNLEKVYNNMTTKPFKRVLFCGDRIVSFNRLAEIPVRLHTSKTCIRCSYLLPKSELPKGLTDIF